MKKIISSLVLVSFGFALVGTLTVAVVARPAQAMTWGELKCMYNTECAAALKKLREEAANKNAE